MPAHTTEAPPPTRHAPGEPRPECALKDLPASTSDASPDLAGDPYLMLDPTLLVDRIAEASVVLFLPSTGKSLKLSRPVYELLRRFAAPRGLESVLPAGPRRDVARACLEVLASKGVLVPPSDVFSAEPAGARPVRVADVSGLERRLTCTESAGPLPQ